MCLRTLKPIVRTQWKVLPTLKLCGADEKDKHIGQDPVSTRGDPVVVEFMSSWVCLRTRRRLTEFC